MLDQILGQWILLWLKELPYVRAAICTYVQEDLVASLQECAQILSSLISTSAEQGSTHHLEAQKRRKIIPFTAKDRKHHLEARPEVSQALGERRVLRNALALRTRHRHLRARLGGKATASTWVATELRQSRRNGVLEPKPSRGLASRRLTGSAIALQTFSKLK